MEINELYNIAKQYADLIRQEKPEFVSDAESAICVIVDQNDQIVTGITSVTVKGGQIELIPAETVAVRRFIDNSQGTARQIVTMMFKDSQVIETGKASLAILAQANPANGDCRVATSAEEDAALRDLVPVPEVVEEQPAEAPAEEQPAEASAEEAKSDEAAEEETPAKALEKEALSEIENMEDLMDGFDVDTSASAEEVQPVEPAEQAPVAAANVPTENVGAPAEFADGFSVDESNPFFEEEAAPSDSDVKTIDSGVKSMFDQPDDAAKQGAAGFQMPPMMQGYPQQGMGYPQQGMGYPQQGMQSGYPQQGMGYPQQGMQSGYPQQGMGYPQQGMQSGYPQQGMGYPQQGVQQPMQGGYPTAGAYQQGLNNPDQPHNSIPAPDSEKDKPLDADENVKPSTSPAADADDEEEEEAPMTIEEMRKAAKQKKKNAKINSNFKKKMRNNGF